jgi:hypothetical protein
MVKNGYGTPYHLRSHSAATQSVAVQENRLTDMLTLDSKTRLIGMALLLGLIVIILFPNPVLASETIRDPLFRIERNKNANIVQYDAQVESDGTLHSKEPVVGYWIRLAEHGQIEELTWSQKKFAYGFSVQLNKTADGATLKLAADIGRKVIVRRNGDDFVAEVDINGKKSYLERIYIHATGTGISTKVDYIEIHGTAVINQERVFETFNP